MSLTKKLIMYFLHVFMTRLIRFGAKESLRIDWVLVNHGDVRLQLLKGPAFPRIDAEVRMSSLREMVEKMRFHKLTFKELDINPLEFWEKLKRYAREVYKEVQADFYGSYFGRHVAKRCIAIMGDVLKFVHEQTTSTATAQAAS